MERNIKRRRYPLPRKYPEFKSTNDALNAAPQAAGDPAFRRFL